MKTKMIAIAGMAMAGALVGGTASAANMTFGDYVNVVVPGSTAVTFTSSTDSSPEFFIGITALPANFVSGTVILTEPKTGAFSDLLSLLLAPNGGVDIFFFSDPSVAPPADISDHQLTLTETGGVQDVSSFFGGGAMVQVGSDLDVPEPATWTMMLVGLGFAGALMRARRTATLAA